MAEFTSLNGYQVKDAVARSIAKGRNQAVAFVDYATMIETLNEFEKDEYRAGQNVYIGVVGVPDLWVYSVEDIRHTFTYTSDEDFVEMLKSNTTVQVGFFKLAMLEGQKVDLTTYDQHLAKHDEDIEKNATSLGGVSTSEYSALSLAKALASMCDKYMSKNDNISYNGRFLCDSGWYSYNVYHEGSYWSGFVVHITQDKSYSFRRLVGADAVLKKLCSAVTFQQVGTVQANTTTASCTIDTSMSQVIIAFFYGYSYSGTICSVFYDANTKSLSYVNQYANTYIGTSASLSGNTITFTSPNQSYYATAIMSVFAS